MHPSEPPINLVSEMESLGIRETLREMDRDLVGRGPLMTRIRELVFLLLVNKARQHMHLSKGLGVPHMAFLGSPGTGKSIVAARVAKILYRLGYTRSPTLHTLHAADLLDRNIEASIRKTQKILTESGARTFYLSLDLLQRSEAGLQVIPTLEAALARNKTPFVFILGGNCRCMIRLFQERGVLSQTLVHRLEFPDYSYDELMLIAQRTLKEWNYQFSPAGEAAFAEYLPLRMELDHFANAQSVKNALQRACLRQAKRLCESGVEALDKGALMTLEAEDIFAVRS